jgi:multidrug resistance protein, MATE family
VKALGIQGNVIKLNFIAYWIINLPLCYLLAFQLQLGHRGIWIAIVTAQVFLAICFQVMIEITDWDKVAQESQER